MTELELAICEAQNDGEIDLDTRDALLVTLETGTKSDATCLADLRHDRNDREIFDRTLDYDRKHGSMINKKRYAKYKGIKVNSINPKEVLMKNMLYKNVDAHNKTVLDNEKKLSKELENIHKRKKEMKKYYDARLQYRTDGKEGGDIMIPKKADKYFKKQVSHGYKDYEKEYDDDDDKKIKDLEKEIESKTGTEKKYAERKLEKLKAMKESVYEKELAGEITVEEREALLSYMEEALADK